MARPRVAAVVAFSALMTMQLTFPANGEDVRRLLSPEQHHAYEQVMARRRRPPPKKWSDLRYKIPRRTEDAEQAT